MITDDLRRDLENELGSPLPDRAWNYLLDKDFLSEVFEGEWTIRDLAKETRELLSAFGFSVPMPRRRVEMISAKKQSSVTTGLPERREVISSLLAARASQHPEVIQFRDDVLSDTLLSPKDVPGWVSRMKDEEGLASTWLSVLVPDGHDVQFDKYQAYTSPPLTISKQSPAVPQGYLLLEYLDEEDYDPFRSVRIKVGGTLHRLGQLSRKLAAGYGWEAPQATNFVLTGHTPLIKTIEGNRRENSAISALARIQLTIDPAMSPADVAKFYRGMRRQYVSGRHREITEKHTRLAMFVSTRPTGDQIRDRMAAWNKAFPQWKYRADTNFDRDCKNALRRLLHPYTMWIPSNDPPSGSDDEA